MGDIVQFKPKKPAGSEQNPFGDMAFCCPECMTIFWILRYDWMCECQNGHVFDFMFWDMDPDHKVKVDD